MIDEVSEVKEYMDGHHLEDPDNYYRAIYMMSKFYRDTGFDREQAFDRIAEWVRRYNLTLSFSLDNAIYAGYENEKKLRCGEAVYVSDEDVHRIKLYARNKTDRMAALGLLCCAKAFADSKGVFTLSISALASWLGMDRSNLHKRQLKRLEKSGYVKHVTPQSSLRGWNKNENRNASRFKILVQYTKDGKYELKNNDVRKLFEEIFNEEAP